jgi:hypothetical protein
MDPDTGILSCAAYETCVEDEMSSAGGRCVALGDVNLTTESHRELVSTPCTFSDGSAGFKCDGEMACPESVDQSLIGCGSCIGDYACQYLDGGTTVGENSCVGYQACYSLEGSVGDNSCQNSFSCARTKGKH